VSDDRDWTIAAAVRGMGVVNVADLTAHSYIREGLLQPVLEDWECLEAPPIHLLYRRGLRPSARVRAFVEFVTELFANLERSLRGVDLKLPTVQAPAWHRSKWVGPLTKRARTPAARTGSRINSSSGAEKTSVRTRPPRSGS
jgi:LysR family transcriptional regulator for bpeEF and oprC